MGRGVLGRLGILLVAMVDIGTGSVGKVTDLGRLVEAGLTLFCSSSTGWVFLTLSGGSG